MAVGVRQMRESDADFGGLRHIFGMLFPQVV